MRAEKVVAVRQCSSHPARLGLICGTPEQRVEPDQPVAAATETRHLATELIRVAPIPAVADDQHHRAVTEHAASMVTLKCVQRICYASTAADVVHLARHVVESGGDIAVAEQMRDSSQMCRKREGLDALPPSPP